MTTIQEQIAETIDKVLDGDCGYGVGEHLTEAVMPLVKQAQAEALRDAARFIRSLDSADEPADRLEMYANEIEKEVGA